MKKTNLLNVLTSVVLLFVMVFGLTNCKSKVCQIKHTRSEYQQHDNLYHWYECTVCGEILSEKEEHKWYEIGDGIPGMICGDCGAFSEAVDGVLYSVKNGVANVVAIEPSVRQVRISESYDGVPVVGVFKLTWKSTSWLFTPRVLESVVIPDSVKIIGEAVFKGCSSLKNINIPNSVTTIDDSAFEGCSSLKNINIPNSVTTIGNFVFSGCSSLKSINIPNSVTTIGNFVFSGCSSLKSINIPNSVTTIGNFAFKGCSNLNSVEMSNSVAIIKDSTFVDCSSLKSIEIPNSVTKIEKSAFKECSNLSSVEMSNNVTTIGESAFEGCKSLTNIELSNSVMKIGTKAFFNCDNLQFKEYENAKYLGSNDHEYYAFVEVVDKSKERYTIHESTQIIAGAAFDGCNLLTRLKIPNCVKAIGNSAFSGCSSLESIEIPSSVISIGYLAFKDCGSLTNIEIPSSVISIGYGAFWGCDNLEFKQYGNAKYLGNNDNEYFALIEYTSYICSFYEINENTEIIADGAFSPCSSFSELRIPNSVKFIGIGAFSECFNLTNVRIGNGVIEIGDSAFAHCWQLVKLEIPNSVSKIGSSVVSWCRNLKVYYNGVESDWKKITIKDNSILLSSDRYYYSETQPSDTQNKYWHFVDGEIVEW